MPVLVAICRSDNPHSNFSLKSFRINTVIDGNTNQVIDNAIPVGSGAPTPLGCDVFTNCTNNGSDPFAAAINKETNTLYVAAWGNAEVVAIDGKNNKVIKTFPVGSGSPTPTGCYWLPCAVTEGSVPTGIVVNEKTNTIFTANYGDGSISVIDGETNSEVATLSVGSGAPTPAGCTIFRNCSHDGSYPNSVRINENNKSSVCTEHG